MWQQAPGNKARVAMLVPSLLRRNAGRVLLRPGAKAPDGSESEPRAKARGNGARGNGARGNGARGNGARVAMKCMIKMRNEDKFSLPFLNKLAEIILHSSTALSIPAINSM